MFNYEIIKKAKKNQPHTLTQIFQSENLTGVKSMKSGTIGRIKNIFLNLMTPSSTFSHSYTNIFVKYINIFHLTDIERTELFF